MLSFNYSLVLQSEQKLSEDVLGVFNRGCTDAECKSKFHGNGHGFVSIMGFSSWNSWSFTPGGNFLAQAGITVVDDLRVIGHMS